MPNKSPVLVTISTFTNFSEAQKAKKLLELNAISSYIENILNESVKRNFELKVSSSEYDLAYIILSEHIEKSKNKNQVSSIDFNSIFVCPSCGQLNTNNRVKAEKANFLKRLVYYLRDNKYKITCNFCKMKFYESELIKKD